MNRAERRAQLERMKRRVIGYYGGHAKADPRWLGIYAQTRQVCSCFMCGNPRRHWKTGRLTLQERRALLVDEE